MDTIQELEIIGNWAKSCETRDQLERVKLFLDRKVNKKSFNFPKHRSREAYMSLGIVEGIILTLFKTKFK